MKNISEQDNGQVLYIKVYVFYLAKFESVFNIKTVDTNIIIKEISKANFLLIIKFSKLILLT
jgi:hypothetical protein